MKIILRIYRKGKLIRRLTGSREKWRRFYSRIGTPGSDKWFIRVEYGIKENYLGKKEMFYNEGVYTDPIEAKQALSAFVEKPEQIRDIRGGELN